MSTQVCPGCYSRLEAVDGPTHRYMDSSPACWQIYGSLLAEPRAEKGSDLLVDAYAAQHPGGDSPQATQSVAVHLVTLLGILREGFTGSPFDLRRAAIREQGPTYAKLEPIPHTWPSTVADVAERSVSFEKYASGVLDTWIEPHQQRVQTWLDEALGRLA